MEFVAVIDLGSNSVRLSIAAINEKSYKNVFMKKNMIKLSENMNCDMMLKAPAMQRAADALCEFKQIISEFHCKKVIAVATAAVRKAKNQTYFLNFIKDRVGIDIIVIDGLNEAKFDFYGVTSSIGYKDFVIMDIGGGSTEIILVSGGELKNFESIPIGSRSITEEFLSPETPEKVLLAKKYVDKKIQELVWLSECNNIPIVGLGGCLRAVGKTLSIADNIDFKSGISFEAQKIINLFENIKKMTLKQRIETDGIGKSRGDIILGGLLPFISVAKKISATELIISDSGIRDGILYAISNNIEI